MSKPNYFHPFERGLIVTGQPPIESWQGFFKSLQGKSKQLPHLIGDALVFGYLAYGDLAEQVWEAGDYCDEPVLNKATAYNYKRVSKAWWPPQRKVYPLAWTFYDATAALPQNRQDITMRAAVKFGLNRDEVRCLVARWQNRQGIVRKPVTYPGDRQFEIEQENYRLKEELDNLKSSRMREIDTGPQYLPSPVSKLIGGITSYLQGRAWEAVIIKDTGDVEWIARK